MDTECRHIVASTGETLQYEEEKGESLLCLFLFRLQLWLHFVCDGISFGIVLFLRRLSNSQRGQKHRRHCYCRWGNASAK
ncbi:hypothetical protein ACLKA7_011987 [Drosophila subpalustris]